MSLTVVKYRRSATGETTAVTPAILIKSKVPQQIKKPIIKLEGGTGLVINKIPATIKPMTLKRSIAAETEPVLKNTKYSLQAAASAGAPSTGFHWQKTIGGPGGTTITATTPSRKQQQIGAAISSLPPNTIIQAKGASSLPSSYITQTNGGAIVTPLNATATTSAITSSSSSTALQVRRPTIYIKREAPKRTIRSVTVELVERNPFVHLGVPAPRLPILKNTICGIARISIQDCYITLKKIRQNEDFALLAEYFELSEPEVQQIFSRTIVKLARYLQLLIRWPDSKKYYDRHKLLPFSFRSNLSHVQSLIECVETDMQRTAMPSGCGNYKYILCIMPNGIISYVSEAFIGHHDDLKIFNASNFQSVIPKYLSLVADPGKGVRRKKKPKTKHHPNSTTVDSTDSTTDSADESAEDIETDDTEDSGRALPHHTASRIAAELAAEQTLTVVKNELTSRKVKDFSIPTMRVREPVCRLQMRYMISALREFKILQPCAIQEPLLYQYLNEILVVAAALTNMQR